MSRGTYIGLIDCNNFFVSCECVFEPLLKGRPVGILSNNDGCFIARSNELKALGVEMGAPYFQVKDIVEKHNVVVRSANFALYSDMSRRVMGILKKIFPRVETYSIDEAFIDFNGSSREEVLEEGRVVREKLYKWVGIPVSVGIAKTKTLSKVACSVAKKNKEVEGVYLLETKDEVEKVLKGCKAGDIWGIGRQRAKFLASKGIETAYEFLNLDESWVKKHLSINGVRTLLELRGVSCLVLQDVVQNNKSILRSRSFSRPLTQLEDIAQAIAYHVTCVGEVLRSQNSVTFSIGVFIRTNRHSLRPQYSESAVEYFVEATDYTPDLLAAARVGLERIFKLGYRYHKAGVFCSHIVPKRGSQLDLFKSQENVLKKDKKMQVMDEITAKYGNKSLFYASIGSNNIWQGKRKQVSPEYTTNWSELKEVN